MKMEKTSNLNLCPREEIFSYIDGELSESEIVEFEVHIKDCKKCSDELTTQKRLSNGLDLVLENESKTIEIPIDYSKVVATRARSDVRGLRKKQEVSKSIVIIAALSGILVSIGIGIGMYISQDVSLTNSDSLVNGDVFHYVIDGAWGIGTILRGLGHRFIFESTASPIILTISFGFAFLLLTKLIMRDFRS